MTDKSKPWLAAKTAGDALLEAQSCASHKGFASWCDFEAAAVIEWHEAQRVKVSEWWVYRRDGLYDHEYDSRQKAKEAVDFWNKPNLKSRAQLIHVTCYRRKR